MKRGIFTALGVVLLGACAPRDLPPEGRVLLDDTVTLSRPPVGPDLLTREFTLDENTLLVVEVEEGLVDVRLALATLSAEGRERHALRVENNLAAAGVELAAIETGDDERLRLTLTSERDGEQPGTVHLRVRRYSADALEHPAPRPNPPPNYRPRPRRSVPWPRSSAARNPVVPSAC